MNDERNDCETNTDMATGTTRHRLLRAVIGGFALTACGLLPDWRAAAADNHPVRRIQQRKEQKRQRHHHQRHHRRNQSNHQPAASPRGVQMKVHVNAGRGVVRAAYLALVGDSGEPAGGKDLRGGDVATFQTARSSALLQMAGFITEYVNIFNIRVDKSGQDLPTVTMGYDCSTDYPFACTTNVFAQAMNVGDASTRMQIDGYSFRVTRLSDTAAYQVFDVVISPPTS